MILLFQSWITGRIKLIFLMPIDIILSKTNFIIKILLKRQLTAKKLKGFGKMKY
jgi:hypothetical protein